jgi:exosortase
LIWSYWTTGEELARVWSHDPTYSHGWVVVAFAAALLWLRRDLLRGPADTPSAWGLAFLLLAALARLSGALFHLVWVERVSLLPALAGLCLLVGGWKTLRWAWLAIAYLLFMIPLPGTIGEAMTYPLRRVATTSSTYALQVLGVPAVADGNVILLEDHELGVIDACSGLRMLVVFFALATMVALLVRRLLIIRLLLVASAIPIALVVNVARITLTGVLSETVSAEVAQKVYHELAGWLMMALALGLLWVELQVLTRLLLPQPDTTPNPPALEPRVGEAPSALRHPEANKALVG